MIKYFHILLIAVAVALTACTKKQFTIQFELPADLNSNFRVVFYASDSRGGILLENVAVISNGKGEIKCPARNPAIVYLYPGHGDITPIVIYAERGNNIKVTGSSPDPYTWVVDGNDINKALSEWRNENAAALAKDTPEAVNGAVKDYVEKNPSSEISALLLLTSFHRNVDDPLFRSLWQSLRGDATDPRWTRMVARADMLSTQVNNPGRLRSMLMRSLANGVDTIRPDSVKATLLFFWHNGFSDRKERFDSIRALAREFPDSSRRLIADVCLDNDSISWRSMLRSDSLAKVARLWAPAGLADTRLMKLDVPRSPFFLVFSPDGRQAYRGDDTGKAMSAFRNLIKESK